MNIVKYYQMLNIYVPFESQIFTCSNKYTYSRLQSWFWVHSSYNIFFKLKYLDNFFAQRAGPFVLSWPPG